MAELSTKAGLLIAACVVGGYLLVVRLKEAPKDDWKPKPLVYASSLPDTGTPPPGAPPAVVPAVPVTAPTTTTSAGPVVFKLPFGMTVTMPAEWSCKQTVPMDGLVMTDCAGGRKFQAATAGDSKSIEAFEKEVLDGGSTVRGRQREMIGGHRVLVWGELDEVTGFSTHAVWYHAGVEYVLHKPGPFANALPEFYAVIRSLKAQ